METIFFGNGINRLVKEFPSWSDLAAKAQSMLSNEDKAKQMGETAYRIMTELYSPDAHYEQLMKVLTVK